jgi:LysM repeat protein
MSDKRFLQVIALIIGLFLPAAVCAQVPVEVSNEKMIYDGKVYYMHDVKKGQTLYSLSRAYKVSIDAITRENIIPPRGIQTGQVLRIPSVGDISEVPSQSRPVTKPAQRSAAASPGFDPATGIRLARERIIFNGKPYYMHEVLKGQTLYSLARAYRVTILDIDRENAIPAGGLQAGQILRIPAISELVVQDEVLAPAGTGTDKAAGVAAQPQGTEPVAETPKPADNQAAKVKDATTTEIRSQAESKTQPAPQTEAATRTPGPVREPAAKQTQHEKKRIHKVQKGESLADIAKKYDITVQELKQANKGVIFAMPDMRLVIPVKEDQSPDNQ